MCGTFYRRACLVYVSAVLDQLHQGKANKNPTRPHHYAESLLDADPSLRLVEVVRVLAAGERSAGEGDEHPV